MMTSLKCGICVILSILGIIDAGPTAGATLAPELASEEVSDLTYESQAPMLRAGLDNYDLYPYQDFSTLPIQDIFKTILLEHQMPKRYSGLIDDTLEYDDSDILLDNPLFDNPLLDSALLDNPILDTPYLGSPIYDAGTILKAPLIKTPLIKAPLIKTPVIKAPLIKTPLVKSPLIKRRPIVKAPWLPSSLIPSPFKKRQTVREVEQLLRALLPLFKYSGVPMRARFQIGRQGSELTK